MADIEAWPPSNVTQSMLEAYVEAGFLCPLSGAEPVEWMAPPVDHREPHPPPGYVVCFLSFLERGFGIPAGRLIRGILYHYGVELHNLNPNLVMQAAVFTTVCEGYLGVPVNWDLWCHLFRAELSTRNMGKGVRIPLRVGGCTLQLRQSRSELYIRSAMTTSKRGWQNGWFYLRNDGNRLPPYTGKIVAEAPEEWHWGVVAGQQKRLDPLLRGLAKLRENEVTAATVAYAFRKRSLLPLAQRREFMYKAARDASRMLSEPVPERDIVAWVGRMVHPDLKKFRVIPMRPERGYISLVSAICSSFSCFFFSVFLYFSLADP